MAERKVKTHEERLAEVRAQKQKWAEKEEALMNKQNGVDPLGTRQDQAAFIKAFRKHGGYGFSFASALGYLEAAVMSKDDMVPYAKAGQAVLDENQPIPRVPKGTTVDPVVPDPAEPVPAPQPGSGDPILDEDLGL
jgi:hypothetical protein